MLRTAALQTYRKIRSFYTLNFIGLVFGFVGYFLALTPSLLPRPILFVGIIAGFGFAIGYGIGVLLSYTLRWLGVKEPSASMKQQLKRVVYSVIVVLVFALGFQAADWQNEVRSLVGQSPIEGADVLNAVLVSLITASVVLLVSRQIRRASRAINRQLSKIAVIPRRVVALLSIAIVSMLLVLAFNGVIFRTFVNVSNNIYAASNDRTDPGVVVPDTPLRSGSAESVVLWQDLGRQGRNFIGRGPSQQTISDFNQTNAQQPIRVYVGVKSATTIQQRAELAVKELERTGAFERKVLVVMTATGSGWIEPQAADSIEYMHGGNTALVSIQYSYLPSWISQLVSKSDSTDAGIALFNAVHARWSRLPVTERPKLIAYGLSLGSYGAQAAFSGESDLQNRTDGALFVGSPNFSQPWTYFTSNRDSGSPEFKPSYQKDRSVQFANTNADINAPSSGRAPHTLYLQHPSDPVVWWNSSLILHKPDWLREARGYDVSTSMHWYPFITFMQVSVDQFFGVSVPNGHGHNYAPTLVRGWEAVTSPGDWDEAKSERLQRLINGYEIE